MKLNNLFRVLPGIMIVAFSTAALANTLLDTTTALTQSDPVQVGRISRQGVQQDWVGTEVFGGTIYTEFLFHYHTYTIPAAGLQAGRFVQVHLDDLGLNQGTLFVSAYAHSFNPADLGANWLGDAGQSGNFLGGVDPVFFQVLVPAETDLVIVVWNAGSEGLGVGENFRLIAEQFADAAYSEPVLTTPTPTPTPPPTATPTPTATATTINLTASVTRVKQGKTATLTFIASAAPASATTVNYATSGTALLGTHYTLSGVPNQVTFSPGQRTATVILTNTNRRQSKSATITITNGTGYTIGPNRSASITIVGK